ncbi:S41 family peptidase [Lutibacter citreus]|uniref:S41 family peptidase n=1 Tax=Lutibacter citreus TaxID=2138210 RepID=UPI000DBE622F|nr:S41 family peptidase [Lutibacter citreus]
MKIKIKKWILGVFVAGFITISVSFQSDFFEIAKQINIYTTLFKELNMYYIDEVNPGKMTSKSINYMLSNLDPYTRFYDEQGVEDARIRATGEYGGIGILTRFKNKKLTIREILKNSPAEKEGLKAGDKIIKIGEVDVKEYDENDISGLVNGLPNTVLKLTIVRQNKEQKFELKRKKIDVNPVPYFTMIDTEVGYISFIKFNEKASKEVRNAIEELKGEGMKKLIIDVRGNPGGLLNEAVTISNFFIPKDKIIVTTKAKTEKESATYKTRNEPIELDIPLTILINNRSASASEILSGSLQDYDRALVIGERSFGKGLVQRYKPLSYGTQMKLTISKYYTPSGRCIQELDYTNRDEKGKVPKFSDYGRETYKTEKGRIVYGGGGIQPDVEMEKPVTTKTTETLLKSDAFFNFVTTYFYKNSSIVAPSKFELKDNEFSELLKYLNNNQSDFETETEAKFKLALEKSKSENLNNNLEKKYSELLNAVHVEKLNELKKNKVEILNKLTEEIVKRYYYIEGVYKQKTVYDKTILKAVSILNDQNKYVKLLE